ncbi:MAG TPA: class I SAM-dependent methyltransferase, partial [Candidatus Absconditabacterales bacterium]|nr:class I SAM-dependent methyltransferase [Candidatus Absconditabacterales bacterium]
MSNNITLNFIEGLSYVDFVGIINQWNVLPGSFVTLNEWVQFGQITQKSHLLDIACTTGFSLREVSYLSGCSGIGVDISKYSVESAQYNKDFYTPSLPIKYIHGNSLEQNFDEKFSHILLGASLGFFTDPQAMIAKCIGFFDEHGILLVSPFYGSGLGTPSTESLDFFKRTIGIQPTLRSYKEVMSLYRDFEIIYENRKKPIIESADELKKYCADTANSFCTRNLVNDQQVYNLIYNRLLAIREACNLMRPYQDYSTLILRYRKKTYPNRFVELF